MKQQKSPKSWVSGHINWYDPSSGKGSIIGDDGIWYRIHEFSEILTNKHEALKEKARVEFELAKDSIHPIIKSVRQQKQDSVPALKPIKSKQI